MSTATKPAADKVVICVFDGLRPDFITPEQTPNLARFAGQSTWFREARSVFPSMTRVATTSIATGAPPRVHGVVGNAFLFPQVTREHVLDMSRADDIALAEAATGGRLVEAATFGDVLAKAGKRLAVVHTGSAGSAYLINPRARANGHWTFSIFGRDHTQTPEAVDEVLARFGSLPPRNLPRFEEIDYAEQVLTEHVLGELEPDVALIWFNEPDTSFHYRFLGSPETLSVLKHVDAAFGRILDWIAARPDAERFAVIAASDHGQISSRDALDLAGLLHGQGHAGRRAAERTLAGASIAMTGGNMGEIRILEGGTARRDAIAAWLQEQDFLGMLFSKARNEVEGEVEGSLALSLVDLDHARQPDLVYVLRSDETSDVHGNPGLCLISKGDVPVGGGMHGGLNRHELNTVLMVQAPGFELGVSDAQACGIIDIAPTILALLGLPSAPGMTGRDLAPTMEPTARVRSFELGAGGFRQRLDLADRSPSRILLSGFRI
jgi:phosphonoacetate hydrolase